MLKDLFVQIPSERPVRPVIDAAISLAMNHSAHLHAISVGLESTNLGLAVDGAAAVAVAGAALPVWRVALLAGVPAGPLDVLTMPKGGEN